jgi:hypothetical protein
MGRIGFQLSWTTAVAFGLVITLVSIGLLSLAAYLGSGILATAIAAIGATTLTVCLLVISVAAAVSTKRGQSLGTADPAYRGAGQRQPRLSGSRDQPDHLHKWLERSLRYGPGALELVLARLTNIFRFDNDGPSYSDHRGSARHVVGSSY